MNPRWSLERWMMTLTFAGSAVAIVFGLGVQWNETIHVKANQAAMANSLKTDYVRADVYAADRRELSAAIDRLTRTLEQREPDPAPRGRMFDR
jgi:hypothetical protein